MQLPTRRLTWVVGPPGAGKTTWASGLRGHARVVEFDAMLAPLVAPTRTRQGILGAHGHLARLVRQVELHPKNLHLPPLLVIAGLVAEEDLFPAGPEEAVWLILPQEDRWRRQLTQRPPADQYDDEGYAELWYRRFGEWIGRGLPLTRIDVPFREELLGRTPPSSAEPVR